MCELLSELFQLLIVRTEAEPSGSVASLIQQTTGETMQHFENRPTNRLYQVTVWWMLKVVQNVQVTRELGH